MSSYEKSRFKVFSAHQHLYQHALDDFAFGHPALPPTVTNVSQTLDYILNVLNPKNRGSVATPADLPTGVDTPNLGDVAPELSDYRIVNDDGDGNAAGYLFYKDDGDAAASWHKVADFDFGINGIIQGLADHTQPWYVKKFGHTDYDSVTELPLAGDLAGQHIYGGNAANQHLTLHATNGDDPATRTGYIQLDDSTRPTVDLALDLGTASRRFNVGYFGSLVVGTASMTITSNGVTGSITDTNGVITFGDDNLNTTGTLASGVLTVSSDLVLGAGSITSASGAISFGDENVTTTGNVSGANLTGTTGITAGTLSLAGGSITDSSGAISFGDENLTTTGTLGAGAITGTSVSVDDLSLDGNTLSISTLNTSLALAANGTGVIDLQSAATTLGLAATGAISATTTVAGASVRIGDDTSVESTAGDLNLKSAGGTVYLKGASLKAATDNALDIGGSGERFKDIYLSGALKDGTNSVTVGGLLAFRHGQFRDIAQTQPAQQGDILVWDDTNNLYLASHPDSEITHDEIGGLTTGDAGHTQFALLAGRSGGQSIVGGTATTETLVLQDNSVDGNSLTINGASVRPDSDNAFDLGSTALQFKDLYLKGQLKSARIENFLVAAIPALSSASTQGRIVYGTDSEFLYVDTGTTMKKVGHNTFNTIYNQTTLVAGAITVSGSMSDARNAIWQVCDSSNGEEVMGLKITKTATTVTVSVDVALPAGNYRLIGMEL
jgi:hypothetical protein